MTIGAGRTIRIAGDPQAALSFARDMVEHIKKQPGVKRSVVWQALSGPTGGLVFFSEFEDLSAYDRFTTAISEDKTYWSKIADARSKGLFDITTATDTIFRQL